MSECHRLRVQALPAGDTIGKRRPGRGAPVPHALAHATRTLRRDDPRLDRSQRLILMPGIRSGAPGLLMMSRLSSQ